MGVEALLFIAVGILALAFAFVMLTSNNAVHSALGLIANFGCVAFLFLMLDAPFLSMVQVAVYTGAIMVLFLFVIMLLKAEQSSDTTTRSFPWLVGAATVAGVILLVVLGGPIVNGSFKLPDQKLASPSVRLVNASATSELNLTISGDTLPQPITVSNLAFGKATTFETLPAGTYKVNIKNAETDKPVAAPQTITLANGDVATLTAAGEFNATAGTQVKLLSIPTSGKQAGADEGRLVVVNSASESPVSLVDLGPEGAVTTVTRDGSTVLIDRILAPTVAYQGAPGIFSYPMGMYNLAFLDGAFNVVRRLDNYVIKTDTETMLVFARTADSQDGVVQAITINTEPPFGSPKAIGRLLFTDYLLPVNLVGMLLLVALVGVIVLSRPEAEKSERRSNVRRKVSRPLINVISTQTGSDIVAETPQLPTGDS